MVRQLKKEKEKRHSRNERLEYLEQLELETEDSLPRPRGRGEFHFRSRDSSLARSASTGSHQQGHLSSSSRSCGRNPSRHRPTSSGSTSSGARRIHSSDRRRAASRLHSSRSQSHSGGSPGSSHRSRSTGSGMSSKGGHSHSRLVLGSSFRGSRSQSRSSHRSNSSDEEIKNSSSRPSPSPRPSPSSGLSSSGRKSLLPSSRSSSRPSPSADMDYDRRDKELDYVEPRGLGGHYRLRRNPFDATSEINRGPTEGLLKKRSSVIKSKETVVPWCGRGAPCESSASSSPDPSRSRSPSSIRAREPKTGHGRSHRRCRNAFHVDYSREPPSRNTSPLRRGSKRMFAQIGEITRGGLVEGGREGGRAGRDLLGPGEGRCYGTRESHPERTSKRHRHRRLSGRMALEKDEGVGGRLFAGGVQDISRQNGKVY